MKRYRLHPNADDDLVTIYEYIARDNRRATARLISEFTKRFRMLASQPLMGEQRVDLAPSLRGFCVGNYLILYRPTKTGIEVARVIHAARDVRLQLED
jgi:toxin ParE1/3/4